MKRREERKQEMYFARLGDAQTKLDNLYRQTGMIDNELLQQEIDETTEYIMNLKTEYGIKG